MTTPERPSRVEDILGPETADALLLVMVREWVDLGEAFRRLVGYGLLVYRTTRVEGGEVLLRHGEDFQRVVLLDDQGEPLVRDLASLVWMRPTWSTVTCGFPVAEVEAGLDQLEPIARCDRWAATDLVRDDKARRCRACQRQARRWSAR